MKKIVYFLEGLWLPIHAQFVGIHHLFRGHNCKWFEDPDLWNAHLGWIYCHECPDTEDDVDLVIWGFYFHRVHRILQKLCGLLGHKEAREAMTCRDDEDLDENIEYEWDVPTGHFYCSRCIADVDSPQQAVT